MSSGLRIKAPHDPDFDPCGNLSGSPLSLHGRRRLVPLRGHAPAAVAAEHRGPLPQHRPGADQLPHSSRGREARRGLPFLPAARAVRQDRHPHDGDGNRPVRQLPHPGLRAGVGPRLGAARAISICRTASGTASGFCPRASSNSSARSRRHGKPTAARSTAASSGSTAMARFPCPKRRTTWPAPAARPR